MKSRIDNQGRIYIPKGDKGLFPQRGVIIIDGIEATVSTTSDGRSFICGLKGYVKAGETVLITPIGDNEYSLAIEKRSIADNTANTCPLIIDTKSNPSTTEDWAVHIFEEYICRFPDRFRAIVDGGKKVGDIRRYRDGYNGVFADYAVYDTVMNETVFFEIKGTSKTDQYWGGVTFKELESAVLKGGNYHFAIICTDGRRKDPFVHPRRDVPDDPYGVFMTLKEFLGFTTRASLGIQFTIKYSSDNSRLEATQQGRNAYSEEDLMKLLNSYSELKKNNLAR